MSLGQSADCLCAVGPWVHSGRQEPVTYPVSCFPPPSEFRQKFNIAQRGRLSVMICRGSTLKTAGFK